jgi:hypothetical protein
MLQILIADPDLELILGRDSHIDQRKGVDTKVLPKTLVTRDLDPVHTHDDLKDSDEGRQSVFLLLHDLSPFRRRVVLHRAQAVSAAPQPRAGRPFGSP